MRHPQSSFDELADKAAKGLRQQIFTKVMTQERGGLSKIIRQEIWNALTATKTTPLPQKMISPEKEKAREEVKKALTIFLTQFGQSVAKEFVIHLVSELKQQLIAELQRELGRQLESVKEQHKSTSSTLENLQNSVRNHLPFIGGPAAAVIGAPIDFINYMTSKRS